jgi:arsenite methyltransferase
MRWPRARPSQEAHTGSRPCFLPRLRGQAGERVVDLGSGAGFDCFFAAGKVGSQGRVVGVDMTEEMLAKSRRTAEGMGLTNVEFREGILEEMPPF